MNAISLARRLRLAIVLSHPIQYFSPWFRYIATNVNIDIKVFYLWTAGAEVRFDRAFGQAIQWDIPLLEGYEYEFIANRSRNPGTHHFRGLDNPKLVPALEAWRPDAILLFGYAYASHFRVMLSWRLSSIPLLLRGDSHDLARPPGWKPKLARCVRSLLFRRFAGFLAVGQANADYYRKCDVPDARIHFVPHCVDNHRFQGAAVRAALDAAAWRAELGIAPDARVVLFAGKFEVKKRPLHLLEAFGKVQDALMGTGRPEVVLLFVGSGALEPELRSEAGDRIGRSVFFAPFQNQSRMPIIYACCDFLVLPSESESETWGLVVNEVMNLGRPVIVSTHVGCAPDLVQHGKTGWVFHAGDIDELAATILHVLRLSQEQLAELGSNARKMVSGYSFESATTGLLLALKAVIRGAE